MLECKAKNFFYERQKQTVQNLSLKKINELTIQSVVTGDFNNPNEGRVVKECEAYLTKLCKYFEITKH